MATDFIKRNEALGKNTSVGVETEVIKKNAEEERKYYKCKDCGKAVEYLEEGRCNKCYWIKRDIDWLTAYDNCYGDF